MCNGWVGTAVATCASSSSPAKMCVVCEILAFLVGRGSDSAQSTTRCCSRRAPGAIVRKTQEYAGTNYLLTRQSSRRIWSARQTGRRRGSHRVAERRSEGEAARKTQSLPRSVSMFAWSFSWWRSHANARLSPLTTYTAKNFTSCPPSIQHTTTGQTPEKLFLDTLRFSHRGSGIFFLQQLTHSAAVSRGSPPPSTPP